ncbi:hypothetical protein NEOLEDRAFT_331341 [Neolentinus lepideus HHB14362 ss-1]|uniref:NACHT domain-containing protein n=1 Tax=Neolentinus lepideus HHB14362 ss-1 TaxID=1314782 RepID=A0A165STW1_9AGAM|nr:hypothetical protein NEOLEDRAFT_331341 [Neolentinus lepideus HHB14362 ss-1]
MVPHVDTRVRFTMQRFLTVPAPGRETFLGKVCCPVRDLLNRRGPIILTLDHDTTGASGVLEVEAQEITLEEAFDLVARRAEQRLVPTLPLINILPASKSGKDPLSILSDVLSALRTIKRIHPLINIAWKVFSLASAIYEAQLQQDHNVLHLLLTMSQVYPYVENVANAGVAHIKHFRDDIARLLSLSHEYIDVVIAYVALPAWTRLVTPSSQVEKYKERFEHLKTRFEFGTTVQTLLTVGINAQALLDLAQIVLSRLKPAYTRQTTINGCQDGTRIKVINTILDWASSRDHDKKIMWLYGPPGSGKSAIATTVADQMYHRGRLGAAYFFESNSQDRCDAAGCLDSLTYQLSQFSGPFGNAVAQTIRENPGIVHASLKSRFRDLLIQPAMLLGNVRKPVTVVIDGLDECGDVLTRKELMSILQDELPYVPPHVRLLITSRPEHDIRWRFDRNTYVETLELDVNDEENVADVRKFLHGRLRDIRTEHQLPDDWPCEEHLEKLVERASGVFRWAVLASEVICTGNPQSMIDQLISDNYTDAQALVDWHVFGLHDRHRHHP